MVFLSKNNISVSNVDALTQYLTGGTITIALIIIGFSIVKSFALIFPPAVLFVLSGIVFDKMWIAVLVNCVATACSIILPYFLGKFMGMELVNSLKNRFKAVKKIDDFAGENSFALVFVFKAGGLMPSDLSSLIFGAMNIPFSKYFIASNIGLLFLNVLWTLVGVKGDLSNPLSFVYALPALIFAICGAIFISVRQKKRNSLKTEKTSELEVK
jgi:uncharacterized membrane protein YdjX (TVP38/TMEM64 family)